MTDKEILRSQKPTFLQLAGDRKSYICPACGSGSGQKGTGMTTKDNIHYKCWACGLSGDIIDLYGVYADITDDKEKFKECYKYFGIKQSNKREQNKTIFPRVDADPEENKTDYTEFLQEAENNNNYEYLLNRGISKETQKRFHIGYVADWVSPKAIETTISKGGNPNNLPTSPRCIIPRSKYNYLARDTRDNLTDDQKKYAKQNSGRTSLFNINALDNDFIFVVEGEIDAMSIEEVGGNALALCSTSNVRAFLDYLKEQNGGQTFILMLDNDEQGQKAQKALEEGLKELEINYIVADYKAGKENLDPNDLLKEDPETFKEMIYSLKVEAERKKAENQGNKYNAIDLLDYFRTIEQQPEEMEVKTGFYELDREDRNLYGGLHEGLYIIGAVSSLGKTTFCLQLADQISESGQDVIFFSLEQSKYELMAKSISRNSYKLYRCMKDKDGKYLARETMQVLNGKRYKFYSPEEKKVIKESIEEYEKQAKNLYIYEGRYKNQRLTVNHIRQIVHKHIALTGRKPTVFVDYLQILGTDADFRGTDKQATDISVSELKEISRDYKIPVFAISSFNRENYNNTVSMASFKESGAIEYSSDVLFGLQYEGMIKRAGEKESDYQRRIADLKLSNEGKKSRKEPVLIELRCLKNRNGNLFSTCFNFTNAFNIYEPFAEYRGFETDYSNIPFEDEETEEV